MVYGVIDKESSRYYTYLKAVFDAIENKQVEYNWLITDAEIVAHSSRLDALNTSIHWKYEDGKPIAISAPDYYFLSGEELTSIVTEDDSQWIWGVLSGFEKTIPLDEILKHPLPKADEYDGFWKIRLPFRILLQRWKSYHGTVHASSFSAQIKKSLMVSEKRSQSAKI